MIFRVFVSFLLTTAISLAVPKPFGLNIGSTGHRQAKELFKDLKRIGNVEVNGYKAYLTTHPDIGLFGLQSLTLVFNHSDNLVSVAAAFQKTRHADLKKILTEKYKLLSDMSSNEKNTALYFEADKLLITFDSLEYADSISLIYAEKNYYTDLKTKELERERELL